MRNLYLKKPRKEKQVKMKQISQKKSNRIFLAGLSAFILFCGLTMFVSLRTTSKMLDRLTNSPVVESKKETDRKLEQFLDGFVSRYFTYNSQNGSSEDDVAKLNEYYGSIPEVKNQGQSKQEMSVVSARMLLAKDGIAVYRIVYDTKKDDKNQRVGIEFSIPYGEKDGKYYLEYNPPLLNNTGKSEMRRVLSGRILPKWIPFLLLEILGIRTLLIWQISFEQAVVYLNLGSY